MNIDLTLEERSEIRMALGQAAGDLRISQARRAIIASVYGKLATADRLNPRLIVGVDPFESIGAVAERVVSGAADAIDEEREHTERAVAALGDRYARISNRVFLEPKATVRPRGYSRVPRRSGG